jgi:hypothetical protein
MKLLFKELNSPTLELYATKLVQNERHTPVFAALGKHLLTPATAQSRNLTQTSPHLLKALTLAQLEKSAIYKNFHAMYLSLRILSMNKDV